MCHDLRLSEGDLVRFYWFAAAALICAGISTTSFAQNAPRQIKVPLRNSAGQDAGTATFKTVKNGVKVKLDLKNLRFGEHAVHIHENAVCDAPDFEGAGRHFNPDHKRHGFSNPDGHHNGDFPGVISIGEDHTGEASFTLHTVSLDPTAPDSLFSNGGTSIVIHAHADDQKTDPSGASGNRIACGVIQMPSSGHN
jgi:Cu-Zn family superoxide dismutase